MKHFCTRPNETSLEQKRIKSVWAHYARRSTAKTFSAKTDHLGMISFASVNSVTLFSAKVNLLIKCAFYTNTPLKRPKQETVRIFVINCMPCCNFTVNIGFLAAHEDRNTVKLQSRFSPIRLWPRWTTFVPNGSIVSWRVGVSVSPSLCVCVCLFVRNFDAKYPGN